MLMPLNFVTIHAIVARCGVAVVPSKARAHYEKQPSSRIGIYRPIYRVRNARNIKRRFTELNEMHSIHILVDGE